MPNVRKPKRPIYKKTKFKLSETSGVGVKAEIQMNDYEFPYDKIWIIRQNSRRLISNSRKIEKAKQFNTNGRVPESRIPNVRKSKGSIFTKTKFELISKAGMKWCTIKCNNIFDRLQCYSWIGIDFFKSSPRSLSSIVFFFS